MTRSPTGSLRAPRRSDQGVLATEGAGRKSQETDRVAENTWPADAVEQARLDLEAPGLGTAPQHVRIVTFAS
jgi:hypothetical protein